jgi:endogenous inhibitor of DNA gyrase (YacG/DUF329 family)
MPKEELKILCPYCNAPYTADMTDTYLYASERCETCGPEIRGSIEIKCSNCKKLVYKKEY